MLFLLQRFTSFASNSSCLPTKKSSCCCFSHQKSRWRFELKRFIWKSSIFSDFFSVKPEAAIRSALICRMLIMSSFVAAAAVATAFARSQRGA